MQLLIELAIWYLHQPGTHIADLDSANSYIEASSQLAATDKYPTWENECRFLTAEISYQRGNISDGKNMFIQLISTAQKKGNKEMMARAYHQLGVYLPIRDSMKLVYYRKSFELYQQLQSKEKEIEVLVNIARCEEDINMNLMEKHLQQVLALMKLTNFKHVLYAQTLLTFALVNQTKYTDALRYAKKAIKICDGPAWMRLRELFTTV
jgi:two-component system, sensor histidine kinase PdtaS